MSVATGRSRRISEGTRGRHNPGTSVRMSFWKNARKILSKKKKKMRETYRKILELHGTILKKKVCGRNFGRSSGRIAERPLGRITGNFLRANA